MTSKNIKENPYIGTDRDTFIAKNMGLVHSATSRLRHRLLASGIEFEDAISVGCIGLIKAYNKYNPVEYPDTKFSTYAFPMITGEILREIRDKGHSGIKISRQVISIVNAIAKSGKEYKDYREIMKDFEVKKKTTAIEVLDYISDKAKVSSLETPIYSDSDGDAITLVDSIGTEDDFTNLYKEEFLSSLSEVERTIIEETIKGKTQTEIAKIVGFSQVQVSRVLSKIREKLDKYINDEPYAIEKVNKKKKKKEEEKAMNQDALDDFKRRMRENGYDKLLYLLENTDESYRDIEKRLEIPYSTVAYYGRHIRSAEQRAKIKSKVSKEILKENTEKLKSKEQPEKVILTTEPKLQTTATFKSSGSDIPKEKLTEILQNLAKSVEFYDNIKKFNLEIEVESK